MTYKEIKDKIEKYGEDRRTAFFINGEHTITESKKRMLNEARNKENVALSALFSAYGLLQSDTQVNSGIINESVNTFNTLLGNDDFLERNFDLESKTKSKDINEFKKIYSNVFRGIFELNEKDIKKMIRYIEKKLALFSNSYMQNKKNSDIRVVNDLVDKINENYYLFNKERLKRENTVHHVGTPIDVINAYEALITKEEIIYNLLINAVKDALDVEVSDGVVEEAILQSFANMEVYPDDRELYFDDKAYNLSQNTFDSYEKTYKSVFLLSKKYKSMLSKSLKNHLN